MEIQSQKVSEGSMAIQANGDVIVNDYHQIKEIFNDLYKLNFPELIKEASKKATENLDEYIKEFISSISNAEKDKIQESLKKPESQFLLEKSIENAARYGDKIDLKLLSESIKNALLNDGDILPDLFSYASEIIPKLNRKHLTVILTIFYIHKLGFKEEIFVNPLVLEMLTKQIFGTITNFEKLNSPYITHLVTLGVCTFNHFASDSANSLMERKYPSKYKEMIKPSIDNGSLPFLSSILEFYDINQLVKFPITPIGSAIGFLLAKESVPQLSTELLKSL